MLRNGSLLELIEAHHQLDIPVREDRENFVSDWNVEHPFTRGFLTPPLWKLRKHSRAQGYIYFDEQRDVLDSVCAFHASVEDLQIQPENVVAGPGSTSLLTAFCLWLVQKQIAEIVYLPPLYYTLHFILRTLNIRARPISGRHAFESDCEMRLPNKQTILLLTDPIWFAGTRVPQRYVKQISDWQRRTGSLVLVDGSFQYTQWNRTRAEFTSCLNPEQTFRVISPSKSLAIPAFRFAYLLMPRELHENFLFLYENMIGSSSSADLMFAKQSLAILRSEGSNYPLTDYLAGIYKTLITKRLIHTEITPECGYFVFAAVAAKLKKHIVMGGEYFEQKRFPDYVRINLLKAHALWLDSCLIQ